MFVAIVQCTDEVTLIQPVNQLGSRPASLPSANLSKGLNVSFSAQDYRGLGMLHAARAGNLPAALAGGRSSAWVRIY